ncbi:MAG: hypothetical protein HOP13_01955 [Alphaproteobacteria bacterium]|nr:hypothetical protein [Alphaproteobacteria bacterium]
MGWRRWVAAVFVAVFSLNGVAGAAENWIELRDGVKARFLTALKSTDPGQPKALMVMFVLSNPALVADQSKVIEIADQLFGRVVLVAAEEKEYARAIVNLLKSEKKVGAETVQVFEDFMYVRGGNGVWLRQAGLEPWKVAQDPNWMPPQPETVQLSTGPVYVDYIGEVFAPAGVTKALGVELHSATAVTNIPAKYTEIKEVWSRLDHAKLAQAGFDFVHIENYGEPLRGKFHVRKRVYLDIRRQPDGTWPVLPDTAPFKDGKEPLVAGVGLQFEDDATRFAARAVSSIVPVSNRSDNVAGVTQGIAVSSRRLLTAPSAMEFLTPKQ